MELDLWNSLRWPSVINAHMRKKERSKKRAFRKKQSSDDTVFVRGMAAQIKGNRMLCLLLNEASRCPGCPLNDMKKSASATVEEGLIGRALTKVAVGQLWLRLLLLEILWDLYARFAPHSVQEPGYIFLLVDEPLATVPAVSGVSAFGSTLNMGHRPVPRGFNPDDDNSPGYPIHRDRVPSRAAHVPVGVESFLPRAAMASVGFSVPPGVHELWDLPPAAVAGLGATPPTTFEPFNGPDSWDFPRSFEIGVQTNDRAHVLRPMGILASEERELVGAGAEGT